MPSSLRRPLPARLPWVRLYRAAVFGLIVLLIHRQHAWQAAQGRGALRQPLAVAEVLPLFPGAASLGDWDPVHGGRAVLDAEGERLGWALQTSPEADGVTGFSGASNALIALGPDRRVRGVALLASEDTPGHVRSVREDPRFLRAWTGLSLAEARDLRRVDGVSGSTLTSLAVADGVAVRLGGAPRAPRFPDAPGPAEVAAHLPGTVALDPLPYRPGLLRARGADGATLGFAARTSPFADHVTGYQGPTDLLAVFNPDETVRAVALRRSYDNEPFVGYVTEDAYFLNLFRGFALADLARLDMVEAGIDGVTGATKTSIASAEAVIHAAGEWARMRPLVVPAPWLDAREMASLVMVAAGLVIAFSRLRGNTRVRLAFQLVLVGYVGLTTGEMVSQALLVGWARHGVAWRAAPALAALAGAALCAPLFTRRQVYCSHLCPFGALQDWTRRLPLQRTLPPAADRALRWIPPLLLAGVVGAAMTRAGFNLAGVEPFDALVLRLAGGVSLAIAAAGLAASVFFHRAYCKYGCPTGALLNFLLGAVSDRLGRRDAVAAALAVFALGLSLLRT